MKIRFEGTWLSQDNERIKISGPHGGDDYTLHHNFDGNKYLNSETVPIYFANSQYAHLAGSEKFGRCNIQIINNYRFKIKDQKFTRIEKSSQNG